MMPGVGGVTSYHPSSQEIGWITFRRVASVLPPLRHSMAVTSLAQLAFGGGPIFIPFAHPGAMCVHSYLLAIIQSPMFAAEYDA